MNYFEQLCDWYQQEPGTNLLKAERHLLNEWLPRLFGENLLQVGGPADTSFTSTSPIRHQVRITPSPPTTSKDMTTIIAQLIQFPIKPRSIDVVLLPHALEFLADPLETLQAIKSILIPEGYCLILLFNPISLWGITSLMNKKIYPRGTSLQFLANYKRLIKQAELTIIDQKSIYFRPPNKSKIKQHRFLFMEGIGQMCWPNCGASTLFVTQKKIFGTTPMKEKWGTSKETFSGDIIETEQRVRVEEK